MPANSQSSHAHAWEVVQRVFSPDQDLAKTCADALAAKLQRAADGGTDKSMISQLSAIVRSGRNCIRELAQREERIKCKVFAHLCQTAERSEARADSTGEPLLPRANLAEA